MNGFFFFFEGRNAFVDEKEDNGELADKKKAEQVFQPIDRDNYKGTKGKLILQEDTVENGKVGQYVSTYSHEFN